jgi:hypothetical protein
VWKHVVKILVLLGELIGVLLKIAAGNSQQEIRW